MLRRVTERSEGYGRSRGNRRERPRKSEERCSDEGLSEGRRFAEVLGMAEDGFNFAEGIVATQFTFDGSEGRTADLADDGKDGGYFLLGHELMYVDFAAGDKGGEMTFDGGEGHAAPGGYVGYGESFFVELEGDARGFAFLRFSGGG